MLLRYTPLQRVENALAAALLALVWLVPNHQLPWSAFHHELVIAVVLGFAALVIARTTRWPLPLSVPALFLLGLALVPLLQWGAGLIPKIGTAAVSTAYVAATALAFIVGQASRQNDHARLLDVVMAGLAAAAALNVPVQWIQWLQWYSSDFDSLVLLLVTPIDEFQRPSGMILQPNQLATIQVWGLIGLTWFRHRGVLSTPTFLLLFAWTGVGFGLTQSRAGLLEVAVVAGLLLCALRGPGKWALVITWFAFLGVQIAWSMNFNEVAVWLGVRQDAQARLTAIDGARIDAWRAFGAAILERPWFGFGLTDGGAAYVELASARPDFYIGQRFAHAHNALLDLVLWFGIPLAILIVLATLVWSARRLMQLQGHGDRVLTMAALFAFAVHAMLELPHQFLYFLVPVGFFAGWLNPLVGQPWVIGALPRVTWVGAGAAVLAVSAWISADYFPYQERYTEWRFENNRVGKRPDIEVHRPLLLNQIHDELALYRLVVSQPLDERKLDWVAETARSVNSPPGYYMAAKAFAVSGRPDDALVWMHRFNAIMGMEGVTTIQSIWRRDQAELPRLAALAWPPFEGRTSAFKLSPGDAAAAANLPLPSPSPTSSTRVSLPR